MQARAQLLASFATESRLVAARYLAQAFTDFNPDNEGGPFLCHYQLPGSLAFHTSPAGYTPEDAVENLETCLWQAYHDNSILSLN